MNYRKLSLLFSLCLVLLATLLPAHFFASHSLGTLQFSGLDKLVHFSIYFFLGINLMWVFWMHPKLVEIMLIATLFSLSTEIFQLFIPGRSMDVIDGIANISGLMFAAYLFKKWMFPRQPKCT